MKWVAKSGKIALNVFMLLAGFSMIFPFMWMISTSFKPTYEVLTKTPQLIPGHPTLQNYIKAVQNFPFLSYVANSLFVAVVVTISVILTSSLAGFAFAKYEFKGKNIFFIGFLSTMMIPFQVLMIPLYLTFSKIGWADTYQGVIFPGLISPFGVFLMKQFMYAIPEELLDASRIDGSSEWRIFWTIVMPLSKSALATLSLFTFLWSWNAFLWPVIVLDSTNKYTLPLGIASYFYEHTVAIKMNEMMAVSTIVTIPIIVIFLCLQNQFIRGITLTGMKA